MGEEIQNKEPEKPVISNDSSQIGGISLRGLLAIFVVLTVCVMSVMHTLVVEPLYTLATVVVSFFFGHSVGQSKK